MPAPCVNCPFVKAAQGDDYLAKGRLDDIKFAVTMGQPFYCHVHVFKDSVTNEVDDDTGIEEKPNYHRAYRMCAGAIQYVKSLTENQDAARRDADSGGDGNPHTPEG